jgi:hypothetical protein
MDEEGEEELTTPFRTLLQRAISFLRWEEEKLEQEMIDIAIEHSLDSYRDTLFSVDDRAERKVSIGSSLLETDIDDDDCHLCLEKMKKGDQVVVLSCQHTFHSECVDQLVTHQHIVCPLCRKSIPIEVSEEKSAK